MLNKTLWAQAPANDNAIAVNPETTARGANALALATGRTSVSANDNAGLVCATRRSPAGPKAGRVCVAGAPPRAKKGAREVRA